MAIYLKYDDIPGTVTTKGFENQIEVASASFNAGRQMGMARRSDKNRGHAEPHLSEIGLSRMWDATASVKLFEDSLSGVGKKKATLSFTTTSANVVVAYLVLDLEEVVVSNYAIGSGGDDHPSESFNLNYTKLTVTPYEVKDGKAKKGPVVIYSLPEMKAS